MKWQGPFPLPGEPDRIHNGREGPSIFLMAEAYRIPVCPRIKTKLALFFCFLQTRIRESCIQSASSFRNRVFVTTATQCPKAQREKRKDEERQDEEHFPFAYHLHC